MPGLDAASIGTGRSAPTPLSYTKAVEGRSINPGGVYFTGGSGRSKSNPIGHNAFDGIEVRQVDLDHAREILTRYAKYYDTKTLKMYMSGNRQQRQWIIMAAKELGIMPTTEGTAIMGSTAPLLM